jgi:hypothetical protein
MKIKIIFSRAKVAPSNKGLIVNSHKYIFELL